MPARHRDVSGDLINREGSPTLKRKVTVQISFSYERVMVESCAPKGKPRRKLRRRQPPIDRFLSAPSASDANRVFQFCAICSPGREIHGRKLVVHERRNSPHENRCHQFCLSRSRLSLGPCEPRQERCFSAARTGSDNGHLIPVAHNLGEVCEA